MCKKDFINICLCLSHREFPPVVCRARVEEGIHLLTEVWGLTGVLWVVSGDPGSLCTPLHGFLSAQGTQKMSELE